MTGRDEPMDWIGVATMEANGTIVLRLRAEGAADLVGDGVVRYERDDPHYEYVLDHLGGLEPGEEKPLPPFP